MSPPLRLGLIGAGRWGRNYVRTIAGTEGVNLTLLASRNPASVALAPAGCRVVTDWRQIVDPRELDGLIIASPPALHAEMAMAAVRAGVPVLVEKPLTMDLAEAQALRTLAIERSATVLVGHTHLSHPAYRALKSMSARFGGLLEIRSEAGNLGPYRPDVPALWDWGAHDVAMCLDLVGSVPERCEAKRVERKDVDGVAAEVVEMGLAFPGEVRAAIRVGNLMPRRRFFSVIFDRATLIYDDLAQDKLRVVPHGTDRAGASAVEISPDLPLTVLVREFAASISSGSRDVSSLDLGVKVVAVLAECERSLQSGPAP